MKNIIWTTLSFVLLSMSNVMTSLLMGAIPQQLNLMFNQTIYNHYNMVLDQAGLSTVWSVVNTASDMGVIVCVIFILPLLDSKGRTFVNVHMRCIMTIAIGALQCFSYYTTSAEAFAIAQFFSGAGLSLTQMTTVLFISECAPDKYRGLFSGASLIGNAVGSVLTFSLARPSVLGNEKWVYIPAASAVLALICYFLLLRIHDSPKWLLGQGKKAEATKAIQFYQENAGDCEYELSKIQRELDSTCKDKMSWKECWKDDSVRSSLLIILSICMLTDFSSVGFELIFSVTIYGLVGIDTETALTVNSIASIVSIVLGVGGSFLLDSLGRRPMLYIMFASLCTKDIVMSYAVWSSFATGPTAITRIIGIFNRLLTIFVSGGFLMPHLLIGELLPPAAKVSVGQMALLVPILITTPLSAILPITLVVFPPVMYLLFLFTHPIFIQHVYRYLPETKHRAVCDIVEEVTECVISRRNTRTSTLATEKQALLTRRRTSTYKSVA